MFGKADLPAAVDIALTVGQALIVFSAIAQLLLNSFLAKRSNRDVEAWSIGTAVWCVALGLPGFLILGVASFFMPGLASDSTLIITAILISATVVTMHTLPLHFLLRAPPRAAASPEPKPIP